MLPRVSFVDFDEFAQELTNEGSATIKDVTVRAQDYCEVDLKNGTASYIAECGFIEDNLVYTIRVVVAKEPLVGIPGERSVEVATDQSRRKEVRMQLNKMRKRLEALGVEKIRPGVFEHIVDASVSTTFLP